MRQPLLPLLLLLASGHALSATVYKWVDASGVTHYSDQPYPGAKKIEVEAAQSYSAPEPAKAPATRSKSKAAEGPPYEACEIYKPSAEEVLMNVSSFTAKMRIDPGLRAGDRASVALDGKVLADVPLESNEFTVSPIYRGEHTISGVIQNLAGEVVCQSEPVKFYVRQASELSPKSPQRAKPVKPPKPKP